MRARPLLVASAVALGSMALLCPPAARAHSGGQTGRSGRQGLACDLCHRGGALPDVQFIGPAELTAGAVATYRFEVRSTDPREIAAGFDVAADGGRLDVLPDQGERRASNGELTHSEPKHNSDDVAAWDFTWTAPAAAGVYTLFAAGNSVDLNGGNSGDGTRTTRFAITVADATATATDPPAPTPTVTPLPTTCPGDCDGSTRVTIDELIVGVAIALGTADPHLCLALDRDRDGHVSIAELVAALRAALDGC